MRTSTFLALLAGAGAGFAIAKRLLESDELPEELPQPVRLRAETAKQRLGEARDDVAQAIRDARTEREDAKRELMNDFLHRAGRPPRP